MEGHFPCTLHITQGHQGEHLLHVHAVRLLVNLGANTQHVRLNRISKPPVRALHTRAMSGRRLRTSLTRNPAQYDLRGKYIPLECCYRANDSRRQ